MRYDVLILFCHLLITIVRHFGRSVAERGNRVCRVRFVIPIAEKSLIPYDYTASRDISTRQNLRYYSAFACERFHFYSHLLLEKSTSFLDFFGAFISILPLFTGSLDVARDDVLI